VQAAVNQPEDRVTRTAWIWPVAWAAVIFASSSRAQIVDVSPWPGADKVAHFLAYGLLGLLACRLGRGRRAAVLAVLAASLYGASDEWHQSFVPSRSAEVADWITDTMGAGFMVMAYTTSAWIRRAVETPARLLRRVLKRAEPAAMP
jgi:VanZ family protein